MRKVKENNFRQPSESRRGSWGDILFQGEEIQLLPGVG